MVNIKVEILKSEPMAVWDAPSGWYEVAECNRSGTPLYHQRGDIVLKDGGMLANITQSRCETQWWKDWDGREITPSNHPGDGAGCLYLRPLSRFTKVSVSIQE